MTVPLVRPSFPDSSMWLPRWEESTRRTHTYSNFGPLWHGAAEALSDLTGMLAIPVSTGTAAVELAMYAGWVMGNGIYPQKFIDDFTFEATRRAANHVWSAVSHLGFPSVATVPFGCAREFPFRVSAVDAAGAFGPSIADQVPRNTAIAVSFHSTKNFPVGEGGAVLLPKHWAPGYVGCVRAMNFGFNEARESVETFATNAKLDELRCSILLAQLKRVDYFAERCNRIREHSMELADTPETFLPYSPGVWQSLVVVGVAGDPDQCCLFLRDNGYTARRVYWPTQYTNHYTKAQRSMVALPSDMTTKEVTKLRKLLQTGGWR